MNKALKNISILGDGGWGTALAIHLALKKHSVTLWGAFPQYIEELKKTRFNSKFLPGIKIPKEITLTANLSEAVKNGDLVVLAVPSQFLVDILKKLKKFSLSKKIILSVIKGLDTQTLLPMSKVIHQQLGNNVKLAVLSGPTIAKEVAQGIPSTAVIASKYSHIAENLQNIFNSNHFRIYTNSDVIGVEVGGSVKNVIAIACGVCDGLGFGTNTKAAILTRGLAEIARLGEILGAKKKTFSGLSGLGDLVTTCISPQSRNRFVGEQLGKGKTIDEIKHSMAMIAEGVETVKAVYKLAQKHNIALPISTEVYNIIYKNKKPIKAVSDLMARKVKAE